MGRVYLDVEKVAGGIVWEGGFGDRDGGVDG